MIKDICETPLVASDSMVKDENLFGFYDQEQDKDVTFIILVSTVLEVLARAIGQGKEIQGIHRKPALFTDDMILYVENPKNPQKNVLKLINSAKLQITKTIHKN